MRWSRYLTDWRVALVASLAVVLLATPFVGWSGIAYGCVAGVLSWGSGLLARRKLGRESSGEGESPPENTPPGAVAAKPVEPPPPSFDTSDVGSLVEEMIYQSRYALLLRRQLISNLTRDQLERTKQALADGMAFLPEGDVVLQTADTIDGSGELEDGPGIAARGTVVHVGQVFVDRHQVTNRQYQQFVAAGGYEQMAIWQPEIWAGVLDFVDRTGCPGPRFWTDGNSPTGKEDHPVVGICWYEAAAYARWVGKRLLTDAEWVKAACWPVALGQNSHVQRRYPWGDAMDYEKANLWASGRSGTVSVQEFSDGVSVGGCYQFVGNVWEWTATNFTGANTTYGKLTLPVPMKSVRGGAFDTYFDNQATCQFQTGESLLARKHNVGFRLAVNAADLMLEPEAQPVPLQEPEPDHSAELTTPELTSAPVEAEEIHG